MKFRASTRGRSSSSSWTVKYRLRSRLVASTMSMTASGPSPMIKSRATISSME